MTVILTECCNGNCNQGRWCQARQRHITRSIGASESAGRSIVRLHGRRGDLALAWLDDEPPSGNTEPVGDDQAERTGWPALDECAAPEGGTHREPAPAACESSALAWLLWPIIVVACVAAAGVLLA